MTEGFGFVEESLLLADERNLNDKQRATYFALVKMCAEQKTNTVAVSGKDIAALFGVSENGGCARLVSLAGTGIIVKLRTEKRGTVYEVALTQKDLQESVPKCA